MEVKTMQVDEVKKDINSKPTLSSSSSSSSSLSSSSSSSSSSCPDPLSNAVFVTRHGNIYLYNNSKFILNHFFPKNEKIPYIGTTADGYLAHILTLPHDWVINLDDDAFLTNPAALVSIMNSMAKDGYDYCGVGDGGNDTIRCVLNPASMNPFFNIFHLATLRKKINFTALRAGLAWNDEKVAEELKSKLPAHVVEPYKDKIQWEPNREPYYPLFFYLLRHCRPLYLEADTDREDGITSWVKWKGEDFLAHTWFSRWYRLPEPMRPFWWKEEDPKNEFRINQIMRRVELHVGLRLNIGKI